MLPNCTVNILITHERNIFFQQKDHYKNPISATVKRSDHVVLCQKKAEHITEEGVEKIVSPREDQEI